MYTLFLILKSVVCSPLSLRYTIQMTPIIIVIIITQLTSSTHLVICFQHCIKICFKCPTSIRGGGRVVEEGTGGYLKLASFH